MSEHDTTETSLSKKWFGVKTLYSFQGKNLTPGLNCYEERITIWQANSFEDAIEKASKEAQKYAEGTGIYLGFCQAFEMYTEPKNGAEVYSIMREDERNIEAYIDGMYDTGKEYSLKGKDEVP